MITPVHPTPRLKRIGCALAAWVCAFVLLGMWYFFVKRRSDLNGSISPELPDKRMTAEPHSLIFGLYFHSYEQENEQCSLAPLRAAADCIQQPCVFRSANLFPLFLSPVGAI